MIAVTNTKSLNLIDEDSGILWNIHQGSGVYYGITFDENHLFVAARCAGYGSDREIQKNTILCFNTQLKIEETLIPDIPLRDVHQITMHEGILYVCSTFDDQIGCYDTRTKTWEFWQPFDNEHISGQDKHHINSITVTEDQILLSGTLPQGWIARFDKKTRKSTAGKEPLGDKTHNVWLDNGVLHICSSYEGGIRDEANNFYSLGQMSWTRGYCRTETHRYVGLSENRLRADRENSDSCLVQCDLNFNILRSLLIEGAGMIHDMRILDKKDPTQSNITFDIDKDVLNANFSQIHLNNTLGRFASA